MEAATKAAPGGLDSLATEATASMTTPPLGQGGTKLDAAYPEGQAQPLTNAAAIGAALQAGREAFCLFTKLQSPKATLTDADCSQLGDLWGKVLDKRGIQLSRYMGDHAAEIAAAMGTFSIALAVRAGVVAELAQRAKDKPAEGDTDAQPAPGTTDGPAEG